MFEPVKIAPSILSADFMHLGRDIELIEKAGAGYVHVDVMDGHFVPNLTMGVPVVKQLKKATSLPLDVHLMIANPLEQLPWFLDAGADSVTVHAEALDADGLARAIRWTGQDVLGCSAHMRPLVARDMADALAKARELAGADGLICAFGSLYSVGALKEQLEG